MCAHVCAHTPCRGTHAPSHMCTSDAHTCSHAHMNPGAPRSPHPLLTLVLTARGARPPRASPDAPVASLASVAVPEPPTHTAERTWMTRRGRPVPPSLVLREKGRPAACRRRGPGTGSPAGRRDAEGTGADVSIGVEGTMRPFLQKWIWILEGTDQGCPKDVHDQRGGWLGMAEACHRRNRFAVTSGWTRNSTARDGPFRICQPGSEGLF